MRWRDSWAIEPCAQGSCSTCSFSASRNPLRAMEIVGRVPVLRALEAFFVALRDRPDFQRVLARTRELAAQFTAAVAT